MLRLGGVRWSLRLSRSALSEAGALHPVRGPPAHAVEVVLLEPDAGPAELRREIANHCGAGPGIERGHIVDRTHRFDISPPPAAHQFAPDAQHLLRWTTRRHRS